MIRRVLVLTVLAIAGCKKGPVLATADAGAEAASPAAAPRWTDARIKAYLEFQLGLAAMVSPTRSPDGGLVRAAVLTDEQETVAEQKLRQASGLTDEDINVLNALTAALVSRRMAQQVAELNSMQQQLTTVRAEVPDGSVPEVDAALEVMAERRKRAALMLEERARFGDALIDAALPHEDALLENWKALMDGASEVVNEHEGEHR